MKKTKWVDCVPGMITPIHVRHVIIFLDGKDVTKDCYYARLPTEQNARVKSKVSLFLKDTSGNRYLKANKAAAGKTSKGIVWWKYREDRKHLVGITGT